MGTTKSLWAPTLGPQKVVQSEPTDNNVQHHLLIHLFHSDPTIVGLTTSGVKMGERFIHFDFGGLFVGVLLSVSAAGPTIPAGATGGPVLALRFRQRRPRRPVRALRRLRRLPRRAARHGQGQGRQGRRLGVRAVLNARVPPSARGLTREPVWGADRPLGFLFPKQWAMIWVGYWLVRVPHSRTPSADTQGRSAPPACIDGV